MGRPVPDWQRIDFSQEHVTLAVDGAVRVERTGSNTSGDLLRLLPFLANEGAARTGGLKRGDWITTGSWTGYTLASAGSVVDVQFSTAGKVNLRFGWRVRRCRIDRRMGIFDARRGNPRAQTEILRPARFPWHVLIGLGRFRYRWSRLA